MKAQPSLASLAAELKLLIGSIELARQVELDALRIMYSEYAFCAFNTRSECTLSGAGCDGRQAVSINPICTGAPGICLYAAAPLLTAGGFAVGTICVIDLEPRTRRMTARDAVGLASRLVERMEPQKRDMPKIDDSTPGAERKR